MWALWGAGMGDGRELAWDGCFNVRDLGGIAVPGGMVTRPGAVVRSDNPERLTRAGWAALTAHGVRTIVDLRNDGEHQGDLWMRPAEVTTVRVRLDDTEDVELWDHIRANELDGTPLYYRLFLERKPRLCAEVIAAIANARPGGVLFHCGLGRDRTGMIALLLLALVGAAPEDIAADYDQSTNRLPPLFAALAIEDQTREIEDILARKKTTARAAVLAALDGFDAEAYVRAAGLTEEEVGFLRERLLEPAR
ncbi:tyrosine-protein phosphatase [Sphaerisporangium sp. NPDC051011]|uniref:tyrosine-protein phosphatase n=1 Tax=Sphaerisporangium sp. NPDC051011 TaxID=3155792 RepID=UPI0033E38FF8